MIQTNNNNAGSGPILVSQAYSSVVRSSDNATDTAYAVLGSIIVPGGLMNLNGEIIVTQDWKYTNSASVKTLALDWGGSNVSGPTVTTTVRSTLRTAVKNLNSLNSQSILNNSSFGGAASDVTTAIDTTNNVTIDFKCRWGANVVGEQITLLGWSAWYWPGNT